MLTFEDVENLCSYCEDCPLCKTRSHVVFGGGNKNAKIMFVGEGPGGQEDLIGKVFVGPAGQLLDKMLSAISLTRDDVYLTNVVKCRPPNNRNPKESEKKACINYLRAQVKLINPKIIVCLGKVAASAVINQDFLITKDHGKWYEKNGFLMIATFHPSALLRYPVNKPTAYEDLKIIRAKIDELQLLKK